MLLPAINDVLCSLLTKRTESEEITFSSHGARLGQDSRGMFGKLRSLLFLCKQWSGVETECCGVKSHEVPAASRLHIIDWWSGGVNNPREMGEG